MEAPGQVRAVLALPDVRRFLAAQLASNVGDRMAIVALAFAVLAIDHSASAVGIVLAANGLAFTAALVAGGVVGDRFERRRVQIGCDLLRTVTQGASAALVLSGHADVWSLALLAAASGIGQGFFEPSSFTFTQVLVAEHQYAAVAGLRTGAASVGEVAGPAIGGVVVAAAGAGWGLAADAATFAISALLMFQVRARPVASERAASSALDDLREGWREFTARRWLWTVVASAAAIQLVWGAWNTLGPAVASHRLGGAAVWGAILSAVGVGGLLGSVIATRIRPARPLVSFAVAYASFGVPLACLAAGAPAVIIGIGAFVTGTGVVFAESVWEATFVAAIPEHLLSRLGAYDWLGSTVLVPVGLAIWGPVAIVVGTATALWICAAVALSAPAGLLLLRDVRTFPRPASTD